MAMSKEQRDRIIRHIADCQPFRNSTGSMYGKYVGTEYRVYSYNTCIAVYDGHWTLDGTKYSTTTSQHQSLVRQAVAK